MNYIGKMTGFKATNSEMSCLGHVFELGKWYEVDGEIEMCKRGFHFCVHPSGVWSFYTDSGTRVFKIEAEQVLEVPTEAGADFKLVAKRIRLVEEITPGGDSNTGYSNTGDSNTGNSNTGDSNTGYSNTCNYSAGFFCDKEPKVICFDVETEFTRAEFESKFPEAWTLGEKLQSPEPIDIELFKNIPGITKEKLAVLHAKHLTAIAKAEGN